MLQRFLIAYALLTLGFTGISLGMIANGSATPWNPAWPFVSGVRNICLLAGVLVGGLVGITSFLMDLSDRPSSSGVLSESPEEKIKASRETKQASDEERERVRLLREEEDRKTAERQSREREAARLLQEVLKREAEEQRKKRSAEDAARSGLDDFL